MAVLSKLVIVVLVAVLLLVTIPFVGPFLGLADFQQRAEGVGELIEVGQGALNVHRIGDGRPLIMIHGNPGSAQMMAPLAEALAARGFAAIRYDRTGWGHSPHRAGDTPNNPTAHARDLLDLTASLGLERPVVVGYSYGGGVAMEANRLAPDRLGPMVVLSSVGDPERRGAPGILDSAIVLRWVFGTDWTLGAAIGAVTASFAAPEQLSRDLALDFFASLALPGVPTTWERETAERYVDFTGYRPEAVRGCVLVLHGDGDAVVRPKVASYVAEHIDGSTLEWLEGAGHAAVLTRPSEIAARVDAHVARCDST